GDGYNAPFLPVPPAAHADREAMGRRSDDRLFDAVAAGGYVVNGSNRMPAFGLTLSAGEIRGLVRYIRDLCGCQGPAWSRAGGAPGRSTVLAPFDGPPIRCRDAVVTPVISPSGEYAFTVAQQDRPTRWFRVDGVIGGGHLQGGGTQGFVTRYPDGTLRFLPF